MAGSLQTGDRRVRPRLGSRHGTPLASRGVPGERGLLSSCIWNLGFFPNDARASHCPFVLTSFTGWSSERCPGIGFFSRGDRVIGVLRNVEAPTRPRLECRRDRKSTRLNSSHHSISYAVFCLKKKKKKKKTKKKERMK